MKQKKQCCWHTSHSGAQNVVFLSPKSPTPATVRKHSCFAKPKPRVSTGAAPPGGVSEYAMDLLLGVYTRTTTLTLCIDGGTKSRFALSNISCSRGAPCRREGTAKAASSRAMLRYTCPRAPSARRFCRVPAESHCHGIAKRPLTGSPLILTN